MRHFRSWLEAYSEHMKISEAPPMFHFWTGVSVIAGALARKVWIDMHTFEWTPNFYIVLVAPPGIATKSTAMRVGFSMLRQVKGVHFGPQSLTWQGLLKAFDEASTGLIFGQEDIDPIKAERTYMSCLTCDVSELGTFLKPRDPDLVDFLTDMWDGQKGVWKRALATQADTEINNPWLNIIGCTTPGWMKNNFSSSLIDGGLTSRCIFVWGKEKKNLIAYPGLQVDSKSFEESREKLTADLEHISKLKGPVTLSKEAVEWGTKWYADLWTNRPKHLIDERFSGYIARKQTHIHKVAIVLSASYGDDLIITEEILKLADAFVTAQERDMRIVFDSITDSESAKHGDIVISVIRGSGGKLSGMDIWKKVMRQMTETELLTAIEGLKNAGYVKVTSGPKGPVYVLTKDFETEEE